MEQLCQQVAVMYASLMKGLEMDQTLMPPYQDKLRASLYTNASEKRRKECLSFCKKEREKKEKEKRRRKGGIILVVRVRRCLLHPLKKHPVQQNNHHQVTPPIDQ